MDQRRVVGEADTMDELTIMSSQKEALLVTADFRQRNDIQSR